MSGMQKFSLKGIIDSAVAVQGVSRLGIYSAQSANPRG